MVNVWLEVKYEGGVCKVHRYKGARTRVMIRCVSVAAISVSLSRTRIRARARAHTHAPPDRLAIPLAATSLSVRLRGA